jgi:PAS domain S-box-containing protein
MAKRSFFKSLKGVIVFSFFLIFLFSAFALSFSIYKYIYPQQKKQYKERIEETGNSIVADLTVELDSAKSLAFMLSNPLKLLPYSVEKFRLIIPKVIDDHGDKGKIAGGGVWPEPYIFDANRERRCFFWGRNEKGVLQYYDNYNDKNGAGYHNEEWYAPLRFFPPRSVYWSRVYRDPYSRQAMVTCSVPIYKRNKFIGVSTVDLKLEWLRELFDSAGSRMNGYVFVVDGNNTIISYPKLNLIVKKLKNAQTSLNNEEFATVDDLANSFKEFLPIAKHLHSIDSKLIEDTKKRGEFREDIALQISKQSYQISKNQADLIELMIANPLSDIVSKTKKLDSFTISDDVIYKGEKCYVTVYHMPETYWKVVVVVPSKNLVAPIKKQMTNLIGITIAFILLTLILVYSFLEASMLKPIKSVLRDLKSLEKKKSSQPTFDLHINKNNELGELARLINKRTKLIQNNEKKYRALFNSANDAIFIHDTKGRIVDVNDTMLEMYNVENKDKEIVLENNSVEYWSSENNDFSKLSEVFEKALQGEVFSLKWNAKKYKSDEEFEVIVTLRKINVVDENLIFVTVRDVSEVAQKERERVRMAKYASAIFEQSPLSMHIVDKQGETIAVNNAWEKLWQAKRESVIGVYNPLKDRYSIEIGWADKVRRALNGEVIFAPEKEFDPAKADGTGRKRIISAIAFPIRNEFDNIEQVVITHQDVTEIVEARNSLEAEREKLSVTLRSIGDGVITTDTKGVVDFLNKTAEKITGWKNEDAKGKHISEVFNIIDDTTKERLQDPVSRVMESGGVVELQENTTLVNRDGMLFRIGDSAAPIKNRESETVGVIIVFRDITEKLKTETELEKIKKLESLGLLAGGIAHDFNNLLGGILGNISTAKAKIGKENELFNILDKADKALDSAVNLTAKLLTFAKGGEPIKKVINIGKLVKDQAEFALHGSALKLKCSFAKGLSHIFADEGQIEQVIANLVINAKQATSDKGGFLLITATNFNNIPQRKENLKPGLFVKISIKDQGHGISPENLKKIFDPYFTTKEQGTGLGLATVYSIMQKHGGLIEVESVLEVGTTFHLYFPAEPDISASFSEVGVEVEVVNKQEVREELGKLKILVMDDDKIIQEMAVSMFEVLGHSIDIAQDGEEAIKMYVKAKNKNEPYDVVIMDLTIPGGMGGKVAVKEILNIDSKAKVVVSSGYSNDPVMAEYFKYGFVASIRKPYRLNEMKEVVKKIMQK